MRILISGAGIAGLALARQFKKFNIPFLLIEKRPQLMAEGAAIGLPANAMHALRVLGLGEAVENVAHQVHKIIYTDALGNELSTASLLEPPLNVDKFVALTRRKFHEILSQDLVSLIQFNTTIASLQQTVNGVEVKFHQNKIPDETFSAVIGADGINSLVRQQVFPAQSLADMGVTIWRWICEFPVDNLQPTYMFGLGSAFLAYPIGKNSVYCYTHTLDPADNLSPADPRKTLIEKFQSYEGIAKKLLSMLPENSSIIPGRLRSVATPLFAAGRVALVGDASHACSPMLQQGAASALEDVITLSELLNTVSVERAIEQYEKTRATHIRWITQASDEPMKKIIHLDAQQLPMSRKIYRDDVIILE